MRPLLSVSADVHQQFAQFFPEESFRPYAWLLHRKLSEGNVCIETTALQTERENLPERYQKLLDEGGCSFKSAHLVGSEEDQNRPFILHNDRLYLQRYFRYESAIVARINALIAAEKEQIPARMETLRQQKPLLQSLFPPTADATPDWQQIAAVSAALQNFTIITGGPGTGKTTTVAKLLALLYAVQPDLRVALAAPTGKAAARMAESLRNAQLPAGNEGIKALFENLSPSTIHRLLKSRRQSPYFHHNAENPLPFDLVIVDESSMIDVALFAKLLQAIGAQTRLILLGDKNQLASVEAGSLFGDLCRILPAENIVTNSWSETLGSLCDTTLPTASTPIPEEEIHPLHGHIIALQKSHRFRDAAGIGRLSKAVILNDTETLVSFVETDTDEQVQVDAGYRKEVFENFIAGYEAFIQEPDIAQALALINRQRVLVVTRQGPYGLYETNLAIEHYLERRKLLRPAQGHYHNRPVILTQNYPELGLFNGDTGLVRLDEKKVLRVWFEDAAGTLRQVLPGYVAAAETAFAMTIHKSQGSEFDSVLIRLPQNENMALMSRELLYTGITRARQKVIIQGETPVILKTAERQIERASGIHGRF